MPGHTLLNGWADIQTKQNRNNQYDYEGGTVDFWTIRSLGYRRLQHQTTSHSHLTIYDIRFSPVSSEKYEAAKLPFGMSGSVHKRKRRDWLLPQKLLVILFSQTYLNQSTPCGFSLHCIYQRLLLSVGTSNFLEAPSQPFSHLILTLWNRQDWYYCNLGR